MRKVRVVIGIDIGTSGTKVIAVAENGQVYATSTKEYALYTPKTGFAEQHASDWWDATVQAIRESIQTAKRSGWILSIEGISFSGQMHGLVPLDEKGQPIRPAIIWCDSRSVKEAAALEKEIGLEKIIAWTQNAPLPNFTLTKLLWMKNAEPDAYRRISKFVLPKDYVRYRFTGELGIDVADASGTLMLDVAKRDWSYDMCNATKIPIEWLPELSESTDIIGCVSTEAAEILGIPAGIPVVAGAGDQAAGAIGLGAVKPGIISSVFGTSGVVFTVTDEPVLKNVASLHSFCHALPNLWYVMGVTQSAGGSLQWYRTHISGKDAAGEVSYATLLEKAKQVVPGSEQLLFLPYLMGERTPHLDSNARGAWIGLDWRHDDRHLIRSILEGVCYSLRDCFEELLKLGIASNEWRVSGGGAQGRLWMEIFASVLNQPIQVMKGAHGPAFGAAILAAKAIGWETEAWLDDSHSILPTEDWVKVYERNYRLYRKSYGALAEIYLGLHQE